MANLHRIKHEKWAQMMMLVRPADDSKLTIFDEERAKWSLPKHRHAGNVTRIANNPNFAGTDEPQFHEVCS